jgi:hypothetical protein
MRLSSSSESELEYNFGPELHEALQQAKDAVKRQFTTVQGIARMYNKDPPPGWTKPKTGGELVAHIKATAKTPTEGGVQSPETSDASFAAPQARVEPILTTVDGRPYDVFRGIYHGLSITVAQH